MDRSRTNSGLLVVLQRDARIPLHPPDRDLDPGLDPRRAAAARLVAAAHPVLAADLGGYAQGVALLIAVLAAGDAQRLVLEDPSSVDDALPTAQAAGLEVIGVPVDRDGIRVDLLRETGADAVILTPSQITTPISGWRRLMAWAASMPSTW
jgi:DNA-binding transcriptional MocR family regulator